MSIDLPPPPPPTVPRPKLNKPITLIAGCGLGIASVLFFLVVALGLAFVILPNRALPKARVFIDNVYAKAESNKNLTKDQLSIYGEILKTIDMPDASVFVVNVGGAVMYDHLKDGALSTEEIAEATTLRDELNKNVKGGVLALMSYVKVHPDMQKRLTAFSQEVAIESAAGGLAG